MDYNDYIAGKVKAVRAVGFEAPSDLNSALFDWQKLLVRWATKQGSCALFEECGLGKTLQQLEWARLVCEHTKQEVIIWCPLAVMPQTVREGQKFGIKVNPCRENSDIVPGEINIANYDRIDKFDCSRFAGVVLDESSILKSFNGVTRNKLGEAFGRTRFKLCCTATPAPNDFTELGQHAEFLGVCSSAQMLATYFVNDTFDTGTWRLKGHAVEPFWKWVSTWAACVSKPSDLGFSDEGFDLPPVVNHLVTVKVDHRADAGSGELFRDTTVSATQIHAENRRTINERVKAAADIVNASKESFIVWCSLNVESDLLESSMQNSLQVSGDTSPRDQEDIVEWFIGELCICNHERFRDRLATWPRNQTDIGRNTTPKTETNGLLNPASTKEHTGMSGESTRQNTTQKINTSGTIEHKSSGTKTTMQEGVNTHLTSSPESKLESNHQNGSPTIQRKDSHSESNDTTSLLKSSLECSQNKEGCAQFAEQKKTTDSQIRGAESSTSITATKPGKSEACFAQTAITQLESSKTLQSLSIEQRCICGNQSGKRVLICKSQQFGFGMNFQHCRNEIYASTSYSFERFYQAGKRIHRFGQKRTCHRYIVATDLDNGILPAIARKQENHDTMRELMQFTRENINGEKKMVTLNEDINTIIGDGWTMHHGDCVRVAKTIEPDSIGFSVFSPPFADLFTYSSDVQDMGNCDSLDQFMEQFGFLIDELHRITMPGRECAVHCCDLLATKWKDGDIEFKDFSSAIADAFRKRGWLFHSRVTIWKDPVTEMQRTKAHGLLYKTLRTDSSKSRVGAAEYLLVFRKRGINPKPITHTPDSLPLSRWQELASPVWMTINQGRVLNGRGASEAQDERHICPLQLDVIERALTLWSAEDDLVFSPFTGIGSEGVSAVKMGRRFVGAELKESYFNTACANIKQAKSEAGTLFKQ
jgi:DNA modification methylase